MKRYSVYGVLNASTQTFETEADSPEEALDKFYDSNEACPSVCNYCSKEVELGEMSHAYVMDENHNEVLNDNEYKRVSKDTYEKISTLIHHLYTSGECEKLLSKMKFVDEDENFYDKVKELVKKLK